MSDNTLLTDDQIVAYVQGRDGTTADALARHLKITVPEAREILVRLTRGGLIESPASDGVWREVGGYIDRTRDDRIVEFIYSRPGTIAEDLTGMLRANVFRVRDVLIRLSKERRITSPGAGIYYEPGGFVDRPARAGTHVKRVLWTGSRTIDEVRAGAPEDLRRYIDAAIDKLLNEGDVLLDGDSLTLSDRP